jgi:hypothetical protein
MSVLIKKIVRNISPILDIRSLALSVSNMGKYVKFIFSWLSYRNQSIEKVSFFDWYPCLNDKTSHSQTGKGHYFYQDIWALGLISKSKVKQHVDVGSRIDGFVGQCSAICCVEFVEFRPIDLGLKNIVMIEGSILSLPYKDHSLISLSCLHVIEHIGLGRYGDPIDSEGSIKAAEELSRVLSKNGNLYLGVPIGKERVEFNAHRIFNPFTIIELFPTLELIEFKAVDDEGNFVNNAVIGDFIESNYACGLFHFINK